jgi:hypothetical protein
MATTDTDNFNMEPETVEDAVAGGAARTIGFDLADPEIETLHNRRKRGQIDLQPLFQRKYVWDAGKASRLIESILLKVPIPTIYLAAEPDNRVTVIDGQQRLTSIFSFIDGRFPDGQVFKLSGLRARDDINKKTFAELPTELQAAVLQYSVRTITIRKDSDPDLRFEIFERLNSGSVPLNDMELRNCIYRGSYMELLKRLSNNEKYRTLLGLDAPDERLRDVEMVLRFASFYHATYLRYTGPMRRFMNRDMESFRNLSQQQQDELEAAFTNAVENLTSLLGTHAFRRFTRGVDGDPSGKWENKANAALFDAQMWVFHDKDRHRVMRSLDAQREAMIHQMATDDSFIDAIRIGTSDKDKVQRRIRMLSDLVDGIIEKHPQQDRCYSSLFKSTLFSRDPTCAICNNRILSEDDAAIDHIQQYWTGGQTIPENARLTHRYCNNARPRLDGGTR